MCPLFEPCLYACMLKYAERPRETEAGILKCAEYLRKTEVYVLKCSKTPRQRMEYWNVPDLLPKDHVFKCAELSRHTKPDILIYSKYSR
jgi:hypothetical protein